MARKDTFGQKPPPSATMFVTNTTAAGLNLGICDDQPEVGYMNYDIIFNYKVV
jgi:hypothetical protein